MSLFVTEVTGDALGFPRVSGDEPQRRAEEQLALAFSPRERG